MRKLTDVSYITVSTRDAQEVSNKQSRQVVALIVAGYTIMSAVSDGNAVHYILARYEKQTSEQRKESKS
jgi:hypothetical protein